MEYIRKVTIPPTVKEVRYFVSDCVKCGSGDISIDIYEDDFGYISKAKCRNKSCDNELRVTLNHVGLINEWNNNNHIPTMIENRKILIETTKQEIKDLVKLQKSRTQRKQRTLKTDSDT
jgi:hypothetical protein